MRKFGWLISGGLLTAVLYLPVWFAYGGAVYGPIHPDYWITATPSRIFPLSALASATILFLGYLVFRRK